MRTYWRASSNLMRLLLVEDDTLLGESMQVALSRQGYTVDWLERGGGVVTALKTEQFTALILDLTLPDMDGLEVLRQIRRAGYTLPVMILTARDDISDRVKGLDGGADEYIGKPFALEELLARLRLIIRRSSGSAEELISVGELDLSLSKQEIYYAQQALKLTRNEYKILASLMTQAGRVMSKELLQQALHGWDEGSSDNAIEVHIHNLRKKLPDNLVKNVRGVGYMIEK
ncbi:Transcriptional regulatory protein BasR [Vibrio cholerae]|nr:Transcriptional regulatory protein BasR [Vibrio cholerae]